MKLPNAEHAVIAPDKLVQYLLKLWGAIMDFPLYTEVILIQNMPEEGVRAGDVGVVVECHEVVGRETGYSVEFFDMLGNTVAVATVSGSVLRTPTQADRPTVRSQPASA